MGSFGRISETREDWTQYTERVENYFVANSIMDKQKKKSTILSVISPASYKLMRSLRNFQKYPSITELRS